jgi:hypothetical protein
MEKIKRKKKKHMKESKLLKQKYKDKQWLGWAQQGR